MKFFLDTADLAEIEEAASWGALAGVTTNPTLYSRIGGKLDDFHAHIKRICDIVGPDCPVSAESVAMTRDEIVRDGRELAAIAPNVVVKIPTMVEGLAATRALADEGIPVNMTLCFTVPQAILAARAGARYISPFVGRFDDISEDGLAQLDDVVRAIGNYDFSEDTVNGEQIEIIAASIRKNGLLKGDMVTGTTRPARPNDKFAALQKVSAVNGMAPEIMALRPKFADLTPVFPDERLLMEHGKNTTTARVIDLTAPIGKGQRGLIVSPPKAGKTTVLKDIAAAITANNPDVHLMYLGIDERPEEATDMERSIRGEVVSSTFDMPSENHIQVAELVIERAKRLVEQGKDVVILLDSITRLARAYNLAQPASGRILSGGVDSTALYPPKRFLGAARNIENGGSLTILASALIETGSKMDEVIFEEFKGTGNMELKLDRYLADRRIFPAIDPISSGTRKEELLMDPQEAPLIWGVRRILANTNSTERAMDMLIKSLKQTNSNQEFLLRMAKKMQAQQGRADDGMEL